MPEEEVIVSSEDDLSKALTQVLEVLRKLEPEGRRRVIETAATFFGLPHESIAGATSVRRMENDNASVAPFSEDRSFSPKQFLHEKEPSTDVERVACLAFYLTHYRGTPHFKTLDISKLNTEAAQIKFSNAAQAVNNATKLNYLASAARGAKQLSALGEQYVMALPDRAKAKAIIARARQRRRGKKASRAEAA